jgi:hypothetical protein
VCFALGTLLAIGSLLAACWWHNQSRKPLELSSVAPAEKVGLLHISSGTISLGTVPQGGQRTQSFTLFNRNPFPVEVGTITTTCRCLAIELEQRRAAGPQRGAHGQSYPGSRKGTAVRGPALYGGTLPRTGRQGRVHFGV